MIFLKSNISYYYRRQVQNSLQNYKKKISTTDTEFQLLKKKNLAAINSVLVALESNIKLRHNMPRFKEIFLNRTEEQIISELSFLKEFESFEYKINFEKFTSFFDFRRLLYQNNPQFVENIYFKNKKVIPTYLSSIFTELFFKQVISPISRLDVENYFLSVMRNMDYKNFFSIQNLPIEAFEKNLPSFTMIQSSFHMALDLHMPTLYKYRFETLAKNKLLLKNKIDIDSQLENTYFFTPVRRMFLLESDFNNSIAIINSKDNNNNLFKIPSELEFTDSKTTSTNVKQFFNRLKKDGINQEENWYHDFGYNIVLITNTFCIPKLCYEIEKFLFKTTDFPKPANILILGNETFYELYSNTIYKDKENNTLIFDGDTVELKKLRIKSFMYEMFMHALDRNNHNS